MIVTFAVAMDVAGKLPHCIDGGNPIARREEIQLVDEIQLREDIQSRCLEGGSPSALREVIP